MYAGLLCTRTLGGSLPGVLDLMAMHSSHVVVKVVFPWKAITGFTAVAATVKTQKWFVPVAVARMGFSFMPEETRSRRELCILTFFILACEWLQMRIDIFAVINDSQPLARTSKNHGTKLVVLIVALKPRRLVCARSILVLPRAVV